MSPGVERIDIADQRSHWVERGFIALAPPVKISIASDGFPHVEVWLMVPVGGEIDIDARGALTFPPGTEADRVTSLRYRSRLTVADVRGSRIDAAGRERFHVYRPTEGKPGAALTGYEWIRQDEDAHDAANDLLETYVANTPRALRRNPPSSGYVRGFMRLNDCAMCHFGHKPQARDPDAWLPLWATDAIGWYVPQAVMVDSALLSTSSSFHDPNADDEHVHKRCRRGRIVERRRGDARWYRCRSGGVPIGTRDMSAADPYTARVCASRRYMYERMTEAARRHFAASMARCQTTR